MTTITIAPETASNFLDVFAADDFANDVAPRMTCTEVEAVISMLRAVGGQDAAATWLDAHAAGDEEGDSHYRPAAAAYVVPVDPMDGLQCDSCQ
jgi:hypothetical protein